MTQINFHNGHFEVSLILDNLPTHPVPQIRKLFKHMNAVPRDNEEAIQKTSIWLAEKVSQARTEIAKAEEESAHTFAYRNNESRQIAERLRKARTRYAQIMKVQTLFIQSKT